MTPLILPVLNAFNLADPQTVTDLCADKTTADSLSKSLCVICGDNSSGRHYDVISCNGCKTFFRRTLVSKRTYKCHKSGDCLFNKETRGSTSSAKSPDVDKFCIISERRCACRCCRFRKCLEVGMNPKAIQTSRSRSEETSPLTLSSSSAEKSLQKKSFNISFLLDMQPCASRCCTPDSPRLFRTRYCAEELNERISKLKNVEDCLVNLKNSSPLFSANLEEILKSPCALEMREDSRPRLRANVTNWDEEFSLQVEYAKSFSWFSEMKAEEQLVILVDRLLYMASLRVASTNKELLRNDLNDRNLQLTVSAMQRAELDPIAFAILNAIIFTDYGTSHLSEKSSALLKEERSKYVDALRLYLFSKYPSSGASHFLNHLSILWSLLRDCFMLRKNLLKTLSPSSFTYQILSIEL